MEGDASPFAPMVKQTSRGATDAELRVQFLLGVFTVVRCGGVTDFGLVTGRPPFLVYDLDAIPPAGGGIQPGPHSAARIEENDER